MSINIQDFSNCKFYIREDSIDMNTIYSCVVEDEYVLDIIQPKNAVIIDLGTHIGGFTIKSLKNGANEVYSVEICKENAELIKKNVNLNGYSCKNEDQPGKTSVTLINKAIHNNDNGIYVKSSNSTHKGLEDVNREREYYHRHVYNCFDTSDKITEDKDVFFQSISLDTIINKYKLDKVNILKMDCEGAEWRAIIGASDETLDKIDIIIGEFNPITDFSLNHKIIKCQNGNDLLNYIGHKFKDITDNVKNYMNPQQKNWYKNLNEGTGLFLYILLNKKYNKFQDINN